MAKATVTIKIGDLPEIQKKLEDAAEMITDLKRQLAEAEQEKARILHDFATMLMALVPKEILDKAIDEALTTPPQEATDE